MTPCDETLHAAAAIVQDLAKDAPPPFHPRNKPPAHSPTTTTTTTTNGCDAPKVKLPGEDGEGKALLEQELAALISRVGNMQSFVVIRALFRCRSYRTIDRSIDRFCSF